MIAAVAPVLETSRLQLREVTLSDSDFLLKLLNDPTWLENIGDRGVRCNAEAESYVKHSIWPQYQAHGYGMYTVLLKPSALAIGICGLVKREYLSAPDLGFALLPDYVGQGYASEAARGVMAHALGKFGIGGLYAIARRGNDRSVRVLARLGFHHEGPYLTPQGVQAELYATNVSISAKQVTADSI